MSVPVRSGRGVCVMVAGFTIYALHGIAFYALGICLPDLVSGLQTSETVVALTGSIHSGLTFGFCIVTGWLIDRFDCHVISLIGNLLVGIGFILTGLCRQVYQLYLTNGIITGIGLSLQFMPIGVAMQRVFSTTSRHAVTGFVISGIPAGIFIFSPIFRFLVNTYGWRASYILAGALFFNGIPVAMLLRTRYAHQSKSGLAGRASVIQQDGSGDVLSMSNDAGERSSKPLLTREAADTHGEKEEMEKSSICRCTDCSGAGKRCSAVLKGLFDFVLLKNIIYWLYLWALFMSGAGIQVPYIFLPSKALNCGLTDYEGSALLSAMGLLDVVGRVGVGLLTRHVAPLKSFLAALLLISLINCLSPLFRTLPTLFLFAIVSGVAHGGFQTAFYTAGAELVGITALAKAMGPAFTLHAIAITLSYPVAALLWEHTGSVDASFVYAGCTAVIASVLVTSAVIKHRKQHASPALQHTIDISSEMRECDQ